jgi:uncharacterized protein (TIGR03435 family)
MFPSRYSPPGAPDLQPSYDVHIAQSSRTPQQGTLRTGGPDFWTASGFTLRHILSELFRTEERLIELPASLATDERYDFAVRLPAPEPVHSIEPRVQHAIAKHFGVSISRESRSMDVYVLSAPDGEARLHPAGYDDSGVGFAAGSFEFAAPATAEPPSRVPGRDEWMEFRDLSMSGTMDDLCRLLEELFDRPVVNETRLPGVYDVAVRGVFGGMEQFLRALTDQTGLVATSARRESPVVVVRRT